MKVDFKANEVVTKAGDADHFINGDNKKIKGKLILTNQRLYFVTKEGMEKNFKKEIMPDNIKEILYFNTMKFFPNGLNIITKKGEELRFVVKKRNSWCELLNKIY